MIELSFKTNVILSVGNAWWKSVGIAWEMRSRSWKSKTVGWKEAEELPPPEKSYEWMVGKCNQVQML